MDDTYGPEERADECRRNVRPPMTPYEADYGVGGVISRETAPSKRRLSGREALAELRARELQSCRTGREALAALERRGMRCQTARERLADLWRRY